MNTTSVRIKFRESSVDGKEGTLYYQVIHNRIVRQIGTDFRLFPAEWREEEETIVLGKGNDNARNAYLHELAEQIKSDRLRFARIIGELDCNGIGYTADDVASRYNELASSQSFQAYMESGIKQLVEQGRLRTSETYRAALNSFMAFREGAKVSFGGKNEKQGEYQSWKSNFWFLIKKPK